VDMRAVADLFGKVWAVVEEFECLMKVESTGIGLILVENPVLGMIHKPSKRALVVESNRGNRRWRSLGLRYNGSGGSGAGSGGSGIGGGVRVGLSDVRLWLSNDCRNERHGRFFTFPSGTEGVKKALS